MMPINLCTGTIKPVLEGGGRGLTAVIVVLQIDTQRKLPMLALCLCTNVLNEVQG